jgi:two-component system chemotaxis sensor kinase CheA
MRKLIKCPESASALEGETILALLLQVSGEAGGESVARPQPVEKTFRLRIEMPTDIMGRGSDPLPFLDELRALGTAVVTPVTENIPALDELDPSQLYLSWDVMLTTTQSRLAIENVFIFYIAEMSLEIEEIEANPSSAGTQHMTAAPAIPEPAASTVAPPTPKPEESNKHMEAGQPGNGTSGQQQFPRAGAPQEHSIRVPAERLDELMNRVGELVIAQSRLRQIAASTQVKSVAEEIERLVLELRDTSMGIRMVPIAQLFNRFRRVVHDLSRDLGKHVDLSMEGEETELDKTVIEQLNDPIVHLIRNAIDHGIESPEGRVNAGKCPTGAIKLSARHAGTEVLVTIIDDGRGLDVERIRARAEERGLIAPDAAVSNDELYQFLFLPGFSTASEITSMSGRGVGMDVVKRTIEALRGKIDVDSKLGEGTRVTLRLPLTLAIIDGLMVRVGHGRYVLPLETVEECVELSAEEDTRSRGRCFLNIRGDLVPFLRLRELFSAKTPPDRFQKVVVVSSGDLKVGLVVDQVIGDHQTVIKSLSKLHRDIEMFSGATILGDGAVALILDIPHLVEYGQILEERQKAAG